MPPRRKQRCCRRLAGGRRGFKPMGMPARDLEQVTLFLDEFEAMRLCDHEGLSQIEASDRMGVSRGTVQRLLQEGRAKFIEVLLRNAVLVLEERMIGESEHGCRRQTGKGAIDEREEDENSVPHE